VPLLKHCKHVILLTGTPAFAKPKDLFNLVTIVRPDVFTNFRDFGVRYCDPKASRFTHGLDFEGASNLSELHYLLKSTIMIRRLKKDVLDQLPEKRRQRIRVQGDPKLTKQIQQMLGTVSNQIDRMAENAEEHHFEPTFMKCYQLTAKAKIKAVLDFLDDLLENEVKFIFFAHHMEMLDEVEQHCRERVNVIRIDGRVPHDQRHKNVHMF
jgi:SWI/SNF-related matrix-associated actin-dependent regulator 1 of chromatin subfamily A